MIDAIRWRLALEDQRHHLKWQKSRQFIEFHKSNVKWIRPNSRLQSCGESRENVSEFFPLSWQGRRRGSETNQMRQLINLISIVYGRVYHYILTKTEHEDEYIRFYESTTRGGWRTMRTTQPRAMGDRFTPFSFLFFSISYELWSTISVVVDWEGERWRNGVRSHSKQYTIVTNVQCNCIAHSQLSVVVVVVDASNADAVHGDECPWTHRAISTHWCELTIAAYIAVTEWISSKRKMPVHSHRIDFEWVWAIRTRNVREAKTSSTKIKQ